MGKIRVLHILHELHPSGAEMMLYNAYPYWEKDCECTILATGTDIGPFAEQLKKRGYEVAHVPTKGAGKKAKLEHLKAFRHYIKTHSYDVVHIHRESLSFEYALLAKMAGCRCICRTVHSTFPHQGLQRKLKSATRWLAAHWPHVKFIAISDGVAENEKAVFSNPCNEVIYNWCNNEKFQYVSEAEKKAWKAEKKVADKLVLVSVGNCAQVKNHELLLNAIALMKKKQDICYYHVGFAEGETDKEKELTEKLGICPYVEFLGSTDPMPYLKTADVYLMTSLREGLSIAALEAIFTGMPVLLAEAPGLLEFRDKGLSNVEYFASTPEALAEKLDAYVEKWKAGQLEPDEKQCERAKELYDCGRQVQKYRKLYQNMTGK